MILGIYLCCGVWRWLTLAQLLGRWDVGTWKPGCQDDITMLCRSRLPEGLSRLSRANIQSGWWFGTFVIFPYLGNISPNWLSYFLQELKPPTSNILRTLKEILVCWLIPTCWGEVHYQPSTNTHPYPSIPIHTSRSQMFVHLPAQRLPHSSLSW